MDKARGRMHEVKCTEMKKSAPKEMGAQVTTQANSKINRRLHVILPVMEDDILPLD
jgi:hypothetical protein